MLRFLRTTRHWKSYWKNRKINWKTSYSDTWNHPHRYMICWVLKKFPWKSLIEIGCGSGANLIQIVLQFKNIQIGGVDINEDAIDLAKETFKGGIFKVSSGEDMMFSDDMTDVVLTDRMLIYVDPLKINNYLQEIKRITRHYIVLCEFYEKSFWKRILLWQRTGYWAYDYIKLLHKHGFYEVILYKIPKELWPDDTYPSYIITAKVPNRK